MDDFQNYENKIVDIDEIEGVDIKINPDFYIHKALLKAQDALAKDNLKDGFLQYRQFIEYIEVLCKAAEIIKEDYDKNIKEFIDSEEHKNITNETVRSTKLANKKLGLLMKEVFSSKTITSKLKL